MTVNQAGFSETGANSLNLNVAQQTTNSVRTVIGAELAANTNIAEATQIYLRYDGEMGTGIDNHVFSAGLRMNW